FANVPNNTSWNTCDYGISGYVSCHYGPCPNKGFLPNLKSTQYGHMRSNGRSTAYPRALHLPIFVAFYFSLSCGRTGKSVVGKHDTVAYKNIILNCDAFTNETVGGDLAAHTNFGTALNLDECADPAVISDRTAIEVYKIRMNNFNTFSEL